MKNIAITQTLFFIFFSSLFVNGQLKEVKAKEPKFQNTGKGQQNNNTGNGTQVVNNRIKIIKHQSITEKNKDKVLLINKYIDTSKMINMQGDNLVGVSISDLREGSKPFVGYFDVVHLKIVGSQLMLSTIINNLDGTFVAEVKDNKLITLNNRFIEYVKERYIEIYNDYHIPVLQIDLDKKSNTIKFGGLFFGENYCYMVSPIGSEYIDYPKPFTELNDIETKRLLKVIKTKAELILKPLHE